MSFVFVDPSTVTAPSSIVSDTSKNGMTMRKANAMRGLSMRPQNVNQPNTPQPLKKKGLGISKSNLKQQQQPLKLKKPLSLASGNKQATITKQLTQSKMKINQAPKVREIEHMGLNDDDFNFNSELDDELDKLFNDAPRESKKKPVDLSEFDLQTFDDDETDEFDHLFS
eukprot:m.9460 g.9460  ORF g.9460 m.9460 type:complete len:169 (+) comp3465_c0_seq1:286-792(+)